MELKMQKRYWKTSFASLISSTPNNQVRPSTDKIPIALLACWRPLTFLSEVTLLPEARRYRKMTTKAMVLARRMITTGASKPMTNCRPLTRQLQNSREKKNGDIPEIKMCNLLPCNKFRRALSTYITSCLFRYPKQQTSLNYHNLFTKNGHIMRACIYCHGYY